MRRLIALLAVFVLLAAVMPAMVGASSMFPSDSVDCGGDARNSAVCESKVTGNTNPITGRSGILAKITDIVALVAGMAAIIVIIVAGIRYVTSEGEPGNVKSAKQTAMYALLGLVVIVAARYIINFVILEIA